MNNVNVKCIYKTTTRIIYRTKTLKILVEYDTWSIYKISVIFMRYFNTKMIKYDVELV